MKTRGIISTLIVAVVFVVGLLAVPAVHEVTAVDRPEGAVEDEALLDVLGEIFPDASAFIELEADPGVYRAVDEEQEPIGFATRGRGEGYGGPMDVMVGVGPDGSVVGTVLMEHAETPGFVEDITAPEFRERFVGKSPGDPVRLDEDIDRVSGATGSARGFTEAVRAALDTIAGVDDIGVPEEADPVVDELLDLHPVADEVIADDPADGIYLLRAAGEAVGYAALGVGDGYGGDMEILVAVDLDGEVTATRIMDHQETPGFVEDIEDPDFQQRFVGRSPDDPVTIGRDIDGVSGATGSARGFAGGVRAALERIAEAL